MPFISIISPCYNEEENVRALFEQVKEVLAKHPGYTYEHIFIDNASKDKTVAVLREIAAEDKRVKVIVNNRNFGHIRSPYYAVLQARGDAAILMASDLQDPPEILHQFLTKWEEGYKVVLGVKVSSDESPIMFKIRTLYYRFLSYISEIQLSENFTGFGLYDREVLESLRQIDEPYPYFRGLLNYLGYEAAEVTFHQPRRKRGLTKNNLYTLYDMAMLGIVNHSKLPLRIATFVGFMMSGVSLFAAGLVFVLKLLFWYHFAVGIAPILISMFFLFSVLLFFVGLLGEYVASIHTQVQKRPLVIVKERINFDEVAERARHAKRQSV